MQHKKLIGVILAVFAVVMVIFAVNNSNSNSNREAYATTTVAHKKTNLKTDLSTAKQARHYLNNKYGDAGWQNSAFTKENDGNDYWTFVAMKDNQNGTVRAGHTLYVHVDGSIVY